VGFAALRDTIRHAHEADLPVILDCKRGDVGSTASAYAHAAYELLEADAVTLSPYLGEDSIHPFRAPGKGIFVVCSTSNPTGAELQDAALAREPLYAHVARRALTWLQDREPGLVVGAVRPEPVRLIRELAPEAWFLMPGLGAQGGSLEVIRAGLTPGGLGVIVPVSRGIQASPNPTAASRALAAELNGIRGKRARPADAV